MRNFENRWSSATRSHLLFVVPVLCATGIYFLVAIRTGLYARSAIAAVAAIVATQIVPGVVVWRSIRPTKGWLIEDLAAGFAIGTAIAVPTQIIAGLMHQRWVSVVLPLVIVAVFIAIPSTRRSIITAEWGESPSWFGAACAALSLVALPLFRLYASTNLLQWDRVGAPHIDTYIHQALASELLTRGPVQWPSVVGERLGYHWFGHAWIAHVTASSSVELSGVLMRVLPAIIGIFVVLSIASAALRLSGSYKVAALAAGLTMMGGNAVAFVLGRYGSQSPLKPESPTLGLGAPTLILLVVVLVLGWRGEVTRWSVPLVALLATVASGTKGSTVPLVVVGLGLAAVAMFIAKSSVVRLVIRDLIVVTASLGLVMVLVFHGSSAGLKFGLDDAAEQTPLAGFLGGMDGNAFVVVALITTFIGLLARSAMTFVMLDDAEGRGDPVGWLLGGVCIAGCAATVVFSHPGRSQYYFFLTSIPISGLGSALGFQRLFRRLNRSGVGQFALISGIGTIALVVLPISLVGALQPGHLGKPIEIMLVAMAVLGAVGFAARYLRVTPQGPAVAAICSALVLTSVGSWLAAVDAGQRSPYAVRSIRDPWAVSQAQIDTARFIRDHSRVNDIVMTNRHCATVEDPMDGCDSRHWLVTAFSERQVLLEGWTASPRATEVAPNGRDSIMVPFWKPEVLRLNDGFVATPTVSAYRELWRMGVRWAFVDFTRPHAESLEPYAELKYATEDAQAWKLVPPTD